jgi:hypothetical protein
MGGAFNHLGSSSDSIEKLNQNFGLVARIVRFVVYTIALVALISSGVQPTVPRDHHKVGATSGGYP